jgi:hypothetical protein
VNDKRKPPEPKRDEHPPELEQPLPDARAPNLPRARPGATLEQGERSARGPDYYDQTYLHEDHAPQPKRDDPRAPEYRSEFDEQPLRSERYGPQPKAEPEPYVEGRYITEHHEPKPKADLQPYPRWIKEAHIEPRGPTNGPDAQQPADTGAKAVTLTPIDLAQYDDPALIRNANGA